MKFYKFNVLFDDKEDAGTANCPETDTWVDAVPPKIFWTIRS